MSDKPFAEIEQFDAKNLKHVETEEKNPLPTNEGERPTCNIFRPR